MKKNPLVSILVPLYNAEKYFSETMESLMAQTYQNIEIIIVDDGSTDNSLNIAKQYEHKEKNIKVFTQKNSGAQVARNKAFSMSNGEYIQYFDADDIMHKHKIATQIEMLRHYGFQDDIVATGKSMTFDSLIEHAIYHDQIINKDYDNKFLFFQEAWENKKYIIGQVWLIPRKINEKVGDWNISLRKNQDGEFFTRVVYNAAKIIFVEKSIVYYRIGIPTNISRDFSLPALRSHLDSYHTYYDIVKGDLAYYPLQKGLAKLYSAFYANHYPLSSKMKIEVYQKLNELGYAHPIVDFSRQYMWMVYFLGIENVLLLRMLKMKLNKLLWRQKRN